MLKRLLFTLITSLSGLFAFAQQDALYSQFTLNNTYLTPAFAGVDGVTRFSAFHRSQWLGYQSSFDDGLAPTTQLVSFNTPIYRLKSGFAAYIQNDRLGPQNNLEAQAMYAYHLGIKESKLSFGIKVGIYSQTINGKYYRYIQEGDPLINTGKESQIKPDLGLGLFYRAEKYYVGIGFNHLLRSQFDFGADSVRGALQNHINFTGGYYYDFGFDVKLLMATAIRSDLNKTQVDLSAIAYFKKETIWAGLSGRQGEALSLLLGYSLLKDKSLRIGSAIDLVLKDREAKENYSIEFMLSYDLPVGIGNAKKVVRTPRYRH